MKRIAMILGVLLAHAGSAFAETPMIPLTIDNPYAYATTSVQANGAVFMTIRVGNADAAPKKLVRAESDVAERIELHTHIMDGDIMMMREVEGYDITAGEDLVLEPMGHHIMLFDLKAPLEAGSEFPMTLYFDDESHIETLIKVVKPGEMH